MTKFEFPSQVSAFISNQPRQAKLIEAPATNASTATITLAILILIATVLRIPGLFTDFWGDEIWSWSIAGQLHSVTDVLLSAPAHIDNNHPLNTLWLYLIGQDRPVWLYRLPALLAGAGSVVLAARVMSRRGQAEATIAAILFGFSFPLVFYSSEARGYSFAVFFSVLSFDFLRTSLLDQTQGKRSAEFLFGLATILGFLSHLTFLHIYVASVVWSMVRVRKLEPNTRLRALRLARLHAIPLVFLLLLYRFFIQGMIVGGAPPNSPAAVFLQSLSMVGGGVDAGPLALLAAIVVGAIFIAGLLYLAPEKSGQWIYFLVAVVVSPAMACTRDLYFSERPQPLMLRYFLVCMAMLLLAIVPFLAHLYRQRGFSRLAIVGALLLFAIGNFRSETLFLANGRGHYSDALRHIVATSDERVLTLSSDNPLRTQMLVGFYAPRLAPNRKISVSAEPSKWLILNRADDVALPARDYLNSRYLLESSYPYRGLSGWTWEIYLRPAKHTL
jgi:hypothetical protein